MEDVAGKQPFRLLRFRIARPEPIPERKTCLDRVGVVGVVENLRRQP